MTPFEQEKAEAEKRLRQIASQTPFLPQETAEVAGRMTEKTQKREGGLLSGLAEDDILLTALFVLLFREDRENDVVMLLILAILLIS